MKAAFKDASLGANFGKDVGKDGSPSKAAAGRQQNQPEMQQQPT